jgi:hypothetical protein
VHEGKKGMYALQQILWTSTGAIEGGRKEVRMVERVERFPTKYKLLGLPLRIP